MESGSEKFGLLYFLAQRLPQLDATLSILDLTYYPFEITAQRQYYKRLFKINTSVSRKTYIVDSE